MTQSEANKRKDAQKLRVSHEESNLQATRGGDVASDVASGADFATDVGTARETIAGCDDMTPDQLVKYIVGSIKEDDSQGLEDAIGFNLESLSKGGEMGVPSFEKRLASMRSKLGVCGDAPREEEERASIHSIRDQKRYDSLTRALKVGKVDPKTHLGQQWRDHLASPAAARNFASMASDGQAALQMEWLDGNLTELSKKYFHERSYSKVDRNVGKMRSISQLVADEGSWKDKAALAGIVKLVVQCSLMDGSWTGVDPQTGRQLFRKLEFENSEQFEEKWKTFTEYVARSKGSGTASAVETGIVAKPAGSERMPQQPVGSAHEGKPPTASGSHSSDMASGKNTDAGASALSTKPKAKGKKATGNGKGKADKQVKGGVPGKGSINEYKEVTTEAFIYGSHT